MGNKKGSPKATAKETKTKKAKQEKQVKEKKQLGFMPYLLVLIAVLLVLMFTMDQTGYLGNILTPAFMGLFGYGVYFIPFYLVVLALFWKTDRENNVMSFLWFTFTPPPTPSDPLPRSKTSLKYFIKTVLTEPVPGCLGDL
jgi:hypothetical protein